MFGGMSAKDILQLGAGAVAGTVGSGYLSQIVLGGSNTGLMGYASDAVATLVLAWAASKFVNNEVSKGVIAGGIGALIKRIWQENVSGTAVSMSGLGNRDFAGMGYYAPRQFALPTQTTQYSLAAASPQGGTLVAGGATVIGSQPVVPPNPASAAHVSRFGRWSAARA